MRSRPVVLAALLCTACAPTPTVATAPTELRAVLVKPGQVDETLVPQVRHEGYNTVVVELAEGVSPTQGRAAALTVIRAGLSLGYWVEVGRCPALAQAHPEWVAQVRGPVGGRAWPWVPIQHPGAFRAQVERVAALLRDQIAADVVLLNDLQGPPSACGCADPLCRTDPQVAAAEAAPTFVAEVERLVPRSRVMPVWTSGLGSGTGAGRAGSEACHAECVAAGRRQWQALSAGSDPVGLLLLGQDLTAESEGPLRGLLASGPRLVPVLRGWDVSAAEIRRQCRGAEAAGAAGFVVAWTPIEQAVEPRPAEGR